MSIKKVALVLAMLFAQTTMVAFINVQMRMGYRVFKSCL